MIDSHAHLVAADRGRYPPAPLRGTLDRELQPFTAEDLIRQMDENGIERAVAVQRAHVYGFNNAYVADAAAQFPHRLVSVGMIDSLDQNAPQQVRYWIRERGMAGIRMTEAVKGSDTAWVCGAIARDVWALATELETSVCLHFMPWNRAPCLAALKHMCSRFPQTTVVVDHFSNLAGQQGPPDFGVDEFLLDLVQYPRVFQKFTMINIGKLAEQGLPCAPVVKRMVQAYGASRIMWGSDVAQSKGSYAELVRLGRDAMSLLTEAERRQVQHETARSVYGSGSSCARDSAVT